MTMVHPLTSLLLANRGIVGEEAIERFLHPDFERDIHDPFLILNMDKAVERILAAIKDDELIVIYGDYDCDGIPGSVILHDLFTKMGVRRFVNYIPHRHLEGYGLNKEAISRFANDGAALIITVDCGITDIEEIELANSLGLDVIVTDHHLPGTVLPPAFAVINSKQDGDSYPDNMLCGAGVAWKLAQALLLRYRAHAGSTLAHIPIGWEKWLLDMAGLSTIADMVPLRNENRVLAHFGLRVLRRSPRPGLQALLTDAGVAQQYLTEEDVGFTIAPRINAASRMDVPFRAFELLATKDLSVAGERAQFLGKLNNERKTEVAHMVKEAKGLLSRREMRSVLVVGNPTWRVGVAGIVANQLAEAYDRPAFVWGREGSRHIKGSCRSDGRVNIVELMRRVPDGIFLDRGGHEFSGGFSLESSVIHLLEDALVAAHEVIDKKESTDPALLPDATLDLTDVHEETWKAVDVVGPFGEGNPKPLFRFEHIQLEKAVTFGKHNDHLKLIFSGVGGNPLSAIKFFSTKNDFPGVDLTPGSRITLLAHLEKSYFRNRPELRLRIADIVH